MLRPSCRVLQPIRIPTLSGPPHPPAPYLSIADSVDKIVRFLKDGNGKTAVLTGAGVSVDSGIRVSPQLAAPPLGSRVIVARVATDMGGCLACAGVPGQERVLHGQQEAPPDFLWRVHRTGGQAAEVLGPQLPWLPPGQGRRAKPDPLRHRSLARAGPHQPAHHTERGRSSPQGYVHPLSYKVPTRPLAHFSSEWGFRA